MNYSNQPLAQCKGQSEPLAENSAGALQSRHHVPLSPDTRAHRVAELRAVLVAPAFQARLRAGERGEQP